MKSIASITLMALALVGLASAVAAPPHPGPAGAFADGPPWNGALLHAMRELNLSDSQKQSLRELLKNARQQADAARSAQPYDMTVLGDPGNANYAAAIESIKEQAAQRITRAGELQLQIYDLLTPEQKNQLPEVLADIKAEMEARRAEWQEGP